MFEILTAVFFTSLLGSTHCVGMCGPFVVLAAGNREQNTPLKTPALLTLYHLGRLASYVVLGGLAGFLGYSIIGLGQLAGVSQVVVKGSGILLILYGIFLISRGVIRNNHHHWKVPVFWQNLIKRGYLSTVKLPYFLKSFMIGFYSGFLPCGWLYSFIMMAIGTQSVIWGMAILLTFWVGTVPALTGFSIGVNSLSMWFRSRTQMISAAVCILFGIMMIVGEKHACCDVIQTQQPTGKIEDEGKGTPSEIRTEPLCGPKCHCSKNKCLIP